MQRILSPFVERKTKETFCFAKFYYSHNYANTLRINNGYLRISYVLLENHIERSSLLKHST